MSRKITKSVDYFYSSETSKLEDADRFGCINEILEEFHNNGITTELEPMDLLMMHSRLKSHRHRHLFADNFHLRDSINQTRRALESGGRPLGKKKACVFCTKNKETRVVCRSHELKDSRGNVTCPILQKFVCPSCGATGTKAHTIKYCPFNNKIFEPEPSRLGQSVLTTPRNSTHARNLSPH